jgi:glutamate-ammonia-ligase adenylyltransferase
LPSAVHELLITSLASPSSEKALLRCEQALDSLEGAHAFISAQAETIRILAAVFSWCGPLSLRLSGDRTLVPMLAALPDPFAPRTGQSYYLDRFARSVGHSESLTGRVLTVHREHTVQLMRILARNTEPSTDIAEINAELSALADAAVEVCLRIAADNLAARGMAPPTPLTLAVIGLGKLGGRELNVSSDIDLIYLYDDREGRDADDLIEYFTRLAELLTRFLAEATELGALYRVDTRLRADGAYGPLVRSMRDYYRYLEMRGEAWERQMLLKARPVAGDGEAAGRFLSTLERFIFPAGITRSPNREIAALKKRIEARLVAEGSKKTHLKLTPGGIRDIEFIVQCLQLLMGGMHTEVRCPGTLPALDALRASSALSEEEHRTLTESYRLYRRIENALQWRELTPAFTLPERSDELSELAAFLGFGAGAEDPGSLLHSELSRRFAEVKAIYDDVFAAGMDQSFMASAVSVALGLADAERTNRFLENMGFPESRQSARNLVHLVTGGVPGVELLSDTVIERFAPVLLASLKNLPDPGGAIERLDQMVDAYHSRRILFDVLTGTPKLLELLVSIAHSSVFLSRMLVRDPSHLDWLVGGGELLIPPEPKELLREFHLIDRECVQNAAFIHRCQALKNREELRVGSRCVSGLANTRETFGELTTIAECAVRTVVERAMRLAAPKHRSYKFSVIAAGRLGDGTMDFGSDLDLIFIYRGSDSPETAERSVNCAQLILSLLSGGGAYKIYDIDARLRPEGGNSVLAVSLDEYRKYLDTRASVWERLAMIRARPVAGNTRLGEDFEESLHQFVYRGPYSRADISRIMDIRSRAVENSRKRYPGLVNVKSGPGGLADIAFIAQTYAAHYGAEHPALQVKKTEDILGALASEHLIDRSEALSLIEAYRFLCDTEKAVRIGTGRPVNTVPATGTESARVARLIGFGNIRRFIKKVEDVISLSRERYDRLMSGLLDAASDCPQRE